MTLWVLDTDHLSLLERGNPKIQDRLGQIETNSVAIMIVTLEEKVKERLAAINNLSVMERVDRCLAQSMPMARYRYSSFAIYD
jgi:hypothetical protein